jgi:hypothetical protein
MTDPTNTDAQHPAILTATGAAPPPAAGATNTDDEHPALVTRPGDRRTAPG